MTVTLMRGDCLDVMATLAENSVDTIITDPPYALTANKNGGTGEASLNLDSPAGRSRVTTGGGFMGKEWDGAIPGIPFWAAALRVAKPGATLMAFGGTRTHHRLMCAIEDAGWELRDTMMWVYGSGFPKSHDISKAIDKAAGAEREVVGKYQHPDGKPRNWDEHQVQRNGIYSDIKTDGSLNDRGITAPATAAAQLWDGWGTALKPAAEFWWLAYKPRDGTFANNACRWGVAGLNIDGGRVGSGGDVAGTSPSHSTPQEGWDRPWRHDAEASARTAAAQLEGNRKAREMGRWPANLVHDGSDEVTALFPNKKAGVAVRHNVGHSKSANINYATGSRDAEMREDVGYGDSGSVARFFYTAKSSRSERTCGGEIENGHPTVKPLALMRYLAKLTATPTGGIVLDPFMGSGTTGMAAVYEGRDFIGIELEPEYFEIATARIQHAQDEADKSHQIEMILP